MVKSLFSLYSKLYSGVNLDKIMLSYSKFPKVLFYHGVEENIIDESVQCIQMKFDLFEKQMQYLKKKGLQVISLFDFEKRYNEQNFEGNEIIITFDDGYKNNKEIVFPFLKSLGYPFSVFVSTKHIEDNIRFPAYTIRSIINYSYKSDLYLKSIEKNISITTQKEKKKAEFFLIDYIKKEPINKVNNLLHELKNNHSSQFINDLDLKFISEAPMNWDEVSYLFENGVEVGSHAHDHILLHNKQTEDEILKQLSLSKEIITNKLGYCKYLAYPNGRKKDVSVNSIQTAQELGYSISFSTWMKNVEYSDSRMFIPRYIAPNNYEQYQYVVSNWLLNKINSSYNII